MFYLDYLQFIIPLIHCQFIHLSQLIQFSLDQFNLIGLGYQHQHKFPLALLPTLFQINFQHHLKEHFCSIPLILIFLSLIVIIPIQQLLLLQQFQPISFISHFHQKNLLMTIIFSNSRTLSLRVTFQLHLMVLPPQLTGLYLQTILLILNILHLKSLAILAQKDQYLIIKHFMLVAMFHPSKHHLALQLQNRFQHYHSIIQMQNYLHWFLWLFSKQFETLLCSRFFIFSGL